jgi:hypothetical protein
LKVSIETVLRACVIVICPSDSFPQLINFLASNNILI